jgi:hypothetical protein
MAKKTAPKSSSLTSEILKPKKMASGVTVGRLPYPSTAAQKFAWEKRLPSFPDITCGHVLGFEVIGFILERPDAGGIAVQEAMMDGVPDGTKQFYVWLMHAEYRFMDKKSRKPVERPLWIQFTDIYSFLKNGDWHIRVMGGWADSGDTTHWEGFVGVIGIAVG